MRRFATALAIVAAALSGCSSPLEAPETLTQGDPSEFVTVSFTIADDTDQAIVDELYLLGEECDEALQAEGIGFLDGDGSGLGMYELFFSGQDRKRMWEIIEPIVSRASLPWTSVQLGDMASDEWVTLSPDGEEVLEK